MRNIEPQELIEAMQKQQAEYLEALAKLDPVQRPADMARVQGKWQQCGLVIDLVQKLSGK